MVLGESALLLSRPSKCKARRDGGLWSVLLFWSLVVASPPLRAPLAPLPRDNVFWGGLSEDKTLVGDGLARRYCASGPAVDQPVRVLPELRYLHSTPRVGHGYGGVVMTKVSQSHRTDTDTDCKSDCRAKNCRHHNFLHSPILPKNEREAPAGYGVT